MVGEKKRRKPIEFLRGISRKIPDPYKKANHVGGQVVRLCLIGG